MKDTETKLKEDFLTLNMSLEWWKENANKIIGKIELLEEKFENGTDTEEDRRKYEEILNECNTLIARGEIENEELERIEVKLKSHFDECDDSR